MNNHKVSVIGLGYVGLPLAVLAARKDCEVLGIDLDTAKIDTLNNNKSYIDDIQDVEIAETDAVFTTDISRVKESNVIIVCVPTPVSEEKIPDLSPLKGAVLSVVKHMTKGSLLIIESTINPGVCDDVIIPLIERETDKKVGTDVLLAHCPERINPGDPDWNVSNINRVVGANSKEALDKAVLLYSDIIDAEIKPMGGIKEAEAVKVVENSFRDINIAFVNELAMSFHSLGINIENVIDGAATKPFAFMPHRPGAGVGGHCIPVDPYYLIEYAHTHGFEHDFLKLARNINENMPQFTVDLLAEGLNEVELPIKGTKVALLGLSYKPNVGDERESPALKIKDLLERAGADLVVHDPYVKDDKSVGTVKEALKGAEAVVIATGHKEFKELSTQQFKDSGVKVIVDGRNIYRDRKDYILENDIVYKGIGI